MNDKEKLSKLIQLYCSGNNANFARRIGITPQALNNWLKRERLSKEAITKITFAFPGINTEWLLTGEGEMIRKEFRNEVEDLTEEEREQLDKAIAAGRVTYVPLIHINSVGGIHSPNSLDESEQYVERLIPFDQAREGDVAIYQSGDSMSPAIPSGSLLLLRKVEDWREYFGYNNVYVLCLRDGRRITKMVTRHGEDPDGYVVCKSFNPEVPDEPLPKALITQVWKVVKTLTNYGW